MRNHRFEIEGMTSGGCAARIETKLRSNPAITSVEVNYSSQTAFVSGNIEPSRLIREIESLGFRATLLLSQAYRGAVGYEYNEIRSLLVISVLSTIVVLVPKLIGASVIAKITVECLLATTCMFFCSQKLLVSGIKDLIGRRISPDLLLSLALFSSWLYSGFVMAFDFSAAEYLFTGVLIIISVILAGRFLESASANITTAEYKKLIDARVDSVYILSQSYWAEVPISSIKKNTEVLVKPRDYVPVDGLLLDPSAELDLSVITGSRAPASKLRGDFVLAGSINASQDVMLIKALKPAQESYLSRLIELISKSQQRETGTHQFIESMMKWFLPVLLALAFSSSFIWFFYHSLAKAVEIFITVLLVASPCSILVSCPSVFGISLTALARREVLIRNISVFDRISGLNWIALDKTGTLSKGELKLESIVIFDESLSEEKDIIRLMASIEQHSNHPIASSLLKEADFFNTELFSVEDFKNYPGQGVEAIIKGETYFLGKLDWIEKFNGSNLSLEEFDDTGPNTRVFLVKNGQLLAFADFSDEVRSKSFKVVKQLKNAGFEVKMVTGDNHRSSMQIGRQLSIESRNIFSNLLPEDKYRLVIAFKKESGPGVMVGDGINDMLALDKADISFAFVQGRELNVHSADITIANQKIENVYKALISARLIWAKVRQNLFFSFLYNALLIPAAALGILSEFGGAVTASMLMVLSSVCVLLNSLLLRRGIDQIFRY